jgi:hypothetical protein
LSWSDVDSSGAACAAVAVMAARAIPASAARFDLTLFLPLG